VETKIMSFLLYTPVILGFVIALMLAIHHYIKHKDSHDPENAKAQNESYAAFCYLQVSDIRNHETWIVASLVMAFSWLFATLACSSSLVC
jgi:hypothetical protein